MPRLPLLLFHFCELVSNNRVNKTDEIYKAKTPLSAAKKAYRVHKDLDRVCVLNTEDNLIYCYETNNFLQSK